MEITVVVLRKIHASYALYKIPRVNELVKQIDQSCDITHILFRYYCNTMKTPQST